MFDWIADPNAWIALATLTALEIVLGIDNIIFISILTGRLAPEQRAKARVLGLSAAMVSRLALLFSITWVMRLTEPLFTVFGFDVTGRALILIGGGLFLLWKSVHEIHNSLEIAQAEESGKAAAFASFGAVIAQIAVIDIVFSLDSVITAVGMADDLAVMVIAIVVAVGVMLFAAKSIGDFVERHPTIKVLALSFLVLVGMVLIAEGLGRHIPKGYVYFAMAFSVAVEMINIRMRKKASAPVKLNRTHELPDGERRPG